MLLQWKMGKFYDKLMTLALTLLDAKDHIKISLIFAV